jgi:hypothetical protein
MKKLLFITLLTVISSLSAYAQQLEEIIDLSERYPILDGDIDVIEMIGSPDVNGDGREDIALYYEEYPIRDIVILSGIDATELIRFELEAPFDTDYGSRFFHLGMNNDESIFIDADCPGEEGSSYLYSGQNGTLNTSSIINEFFKSCVDAILDLDKDGFYETVFINERAGMTVHRFNNVTINNEAEKTLASKIALEQNYPNPFNPTTKISYTLNQPGEVTLKVYDVNGRLVNTVFNGRMAAGAYAYDFDASNLASGSYIYELVTPAGKESKMMTLIK